MNRPKHFLNIAYGSEPKMIESEHGEWVRWDDVKDKLCKGRDCGCIGWQGKHWWDYAEKEGWHDGKKCVAEHMTLVKMQRVSTKAQLEKLMTELGWLSPVVVAQKIQQFLEDDMLTSYFDRNQRKMIKDLLHWHFAVSEKKINLGNNQKKDQVKK